MTEYLRRRAEIVELLEEESQKLKGTAYDQIDYEIIARMITARCGVPVVVFPAPANNNGGWRLVAYEIPQC